MKKKYLNSKTLIIGLILVFGIAQAQMSSLVIFSKSDGEIMLENGITPQPLPQKKGGGVCFPSDDINNPTMVSANVTYSFNNEACTIHCGCYDNCNGTGWDVDICDDAEAMGGFAENGDCYGEIMGPGCYFGACLGGCDASIENSNFAKFCPDSSGYYRLTIKSINCIGGGASLQYAIWDSIFSCNTGAFICNNSDTVGIDTLLFFSNDRCYPITFDGNAGAACTWEFSIVREGMTNTPKKTVIGAIACDSFFVQGAMQTASGKYYDTLTAQSGLDSIIQTNLTVNYSTETIIDTIVCDVFIYDTNVYTNSGLYTLYDINSTGCDNYIEINLTVLNSKFTEIDTSALDSFYVEGAWQTTTGTYYDLYNAANGCDSLVQTNLTINHDSTFISLSKHISNNIKILPNPFYDKFTINSTNLNTSTLKVEMYNISGKKQAINQMTNANGNITVEGKDLERGMYIIELNDGKTVRREKIIKN